MKLIILRGPSGAGKSTVSKEIREKCVGIDIALIEQDLYKEQMLKGTSGEKRRNAVMQMVYETALIALKGGYHVIVEGLFKKKHYIGMFERLIAAHTGEHYVYFFDISFDETVKRHQTRHKVEFFGEEEMREWFTDVEPLGLPEEIIITEDMSKDEIVERILKDTKLM